MADRATPEQIAAAMDWNQRHGVGAVVDVRGDDGSVTRTRTRSIAWLLSNGQPVVMLDGIAVGYDLGRVTAVVEVDTASSAAAPTFDLGGEG
jgi:hypothetical protein